MTNPTILIVDDEPLARENLRKALEHHKDWSVAGCCANAEDARLLFERHGGIDLALLDIRMPGESGLSLARFFAASKRAPLIAFVTAYDEYAIDAFEIYAIDYLQKPFSDQRLSRLLQRAKAFLGPFRNVDRGLFDALAADLSARETGGPPPQIDVFVVRSVGSVERIAIDDVRWIRGAGNYVELKLHGRTVMHRASIGAIAARLPADRFLQVHRTAIVQRRHIRSLKSDGGERYRLELDGGEAVPVSATYLQSAKAELAKVWR